MYFYSGAHLYHNQMAVSFVCNDCFPLVNVAAFYFIKAF